MCVSGRFIFSLQTTCLKALHKWIKGKPQSGLMLVTDMHIREQMQPQFFGGIKFCRNPPQCNLWQAPCLLLHKSACANSDVSAGALCSTVGKDKLKARVSQVHLYKHQVETFCRKMEKVPALSVFLTSYYPYSIRDWLSLSLMNRIGFTGWENVLMTQFAWAVISQWNITGA